MKGKQDESASDSPKKGVRGRYAAQYAKGVVILPHQREAEQQTTIENPILVLLLLLCF